MVTIQLANGDLVYGEYMFMAADHMDDWTVAENGEDEEPTEYVLRRWVCVDEKRRTFPEPIEDEDDL